MTDDLVTWLRAQIDEDERVACLACEADERGPRTPNWYSEPGTTFVTENPDGFPAVAQTRYFNDGQHIARHDPARVLREVEAKRRILGIHRTVGDDSPWPRACEGCGYGGYAENPTTEDINDCPVIRALALPYADRPGWCEASVTRLIVVAAQEHPDRDGWVDEQAQAEAERGGFVLGDYLGREDCLSPPRSPDLCCHVFAVTSADVGDLTQAHDPHDDLWQHECAHGPAERRASPSADLGWWCIAGTTLLDALRRVAAGEDPDMVYTELVANSHAEDHRGD